MIKSGKLFFFFTYFGFIVQSLYFFAAKPDELMAIPLIGIFAAVAAFSFRQNFKDPDSEFQLGIFFWAFSVRLWLGIIFYGWDLSSVFGDEDAAGYITGWRFAQNWYVMGLDGFITDIETVLFRKMNIGQGIIWGIPTYFAGGPSRMIVSVINNFAGSLLVLVVFRIARRVFGSKSARVSAVIAAFWASIVLLSAGTSKEMLVILFEWTLLYIMIRNPKGFSARDGILALPAFVALYITRFYALYLVAGAFIFRMIVARRKNLIGNAIIGTILLGSLMFFLNLGGVVDRDFERLDRQNQMIDNWRRGVASSTGSGIQVYTEFESTTTAIPVATLYYFFAPFPWEIFNGSIRNAFAAIENVAIIVILILGFPATKIFFKDKFVEMAPIFVFCIVYSGFQIWGLSNLGLAWRHKQTVMPLLFMLVGLSIAQRNAAWSRVSNRIGRRKRLNAVVQH